MINQPKIKIIKIMIDIIILFIQIEIIIFIIIIIKKIIIIIIMLLTLKEMIKNFLIKHSQEKLD